MKIRVTQAQMDALKKVVEYDFPTKSETTALHVMNLHSRKSDPWTDELAELNGLPLKTVAAMMWFPDKVSVIPERLTSQLLQLSEGDKIYWKEERVGLTIRARSARYIICSRNLFGKANYSVLDLKTAQCGILDRTYGDLLNEEYCRELLDSIIAGAVKILGYKACAIEDVIDLTKTFDRAGINKKREG